MRLQAFRRRTETRTIARLYGMIVAQARLTAFYADYGVPDTVEGRFDLIVLHLVLVIDRLSRDDGPPRAFGQQLFDAFCRDLDANLREMGTGDLAVPKRMRRFAEAFYGRQAAYLSALGEADPEVFENALTRNIFQHVGDDGRAVRLADYARALIRGLEAQRPDALMRGEVVLPSPEDAVHGEP